MILIVSKRSFEGTTEEVIDWLDFLEADWDRINGEDLTRETAPNIRIGKSKISSPKPYAVGWFRRWSDRIPLPPDSLLTPLKLNDMSKVSIVSTQQRDSHVLRGYLLKHQYLVKDWLTSPSQASPNKLHVLTVAKEIGLSIPETLLTSDKTNLLEFSTQVKGIVTKAISETAILQNQKGSIFFYTHFLSKHDLENLPDVFPLSLFQEAIPKLFEVRSFFLDGKCYSMAIFSQNDQQTQTDFRNYNQDTPNRTVPYQLPVDVSQKLVKLMEALGLKTGSIDLLVTPEDEHVFLEVNPVGQFGMTSKPCNFYLEKKVAEYLHQCNSSDNG